MDPVYGFWPGFNDGCIENDGRIEEVSSSSYCDNGTFVKSTNSVNMSRWLIRQPLYAIRIRNSSLYSTRSNINPDASCKEGFIKCGDPSSLSGGVCLSSSIPSCPITNISSVYISGYETREIEGATLYVAREKGQNPIAEIFISEHHACFYRYKKSISPNRVVHPLLRYNEGECQEDNSVHSFSSIQESDLLKYNGIAIRSDYKFNSSGYEWKMFVAPMVDYKRSCDIDLESVIKLGADYEAFLGFYNNLSFIYIYEIIISILCVLLICCLMSPENKSIVGFLFLSRSIIFILVLIFDIVIIYRYKSTISTIKLISQSSCINDNLKLLVKEAHHYVNSNIMSIYYIYTSIHIASYIMNIIHLIIYCKFSKVIGVKKSENKMKIKIKRSPLPNPYKPCHVEIYHFETVNVEIDN